MRKHKLAIPTLALIALFASASCTFAANSTPAQPLVPLPAFLTGGQTPTPRVQCQGNCSLWCESGAFYSNYFFTTSGHCCSLVDSSLCPDGSTVTGTEWFPVTCGVAIIC